MLCVFGFSSALVHLWDAPSLTTETSRVTCPGMTCPVTMGVSLLPKAQSPPTPFWTRSSTSTFRWGSRSLCSTATSTTRAGGPRPGAGMARPPTVCLTSHPCTPLLELTCGAATERREERSAHSVCIPESASLRPSAERLAQGGREGGRAWGVPVTLDIMVFLSGHWAHSHHQNYFLETGPFS